MRIVMLGAPGAGKAHRQIRSQKVWYPSYFDR